MVSVAGLRDDWRRAVAKLDKSSRETFDWPDKGGFEIVTVYGDHTTWRAQLPQQVLRDNLDIRARHIATSLGPAFLWGLVGMGMVGLLWFIIASSIGANAFGGIVIGVFFGPAGFAPGFLLGLKCLQQPYWTLRRNHNAAENGAGQWKVTPVIHSELVEPARGHLVEAVKQQQNGHGGPGGSSGPILSGHMQTANYFYETMQMHVQKQRLQSRDGATWEKVKTGGLVIMAIAMPIALIFLVSASQKPPGGP